MADTRMRVFVYDTQIVARSTICDPPVHFHIALAMHYDHGVSLFLRFSLNLRP